MKTSFLIAGLAIFLPAVANADVIKQRPFKYSFDVAHATGSDVFVVIANSPDDRISALPAPPQLAMRLSQNETRMEVPNHMAASVTDTHNQCVNCLLGTVRFPLDSAELSHKERLKLDELVRGISAGTVVNLDGYTCDLGRSSHNMRLSLRRAREVASYLRGKNILVGSVEGKGKCCPVSEERHPNRRVEITTQ